MAGTCQPGCDPAAPGLPEANASTFVAPLRRLCDPLTVHRSMNQIASIVPPAQGPVARYRALLADGLLATDPAQAMAAERLQDLAVKLRGYDPPPLSTGRFSRLLRRKPADWAPDARPNGLYLAGAVGRGKSMLMDIFFDTVQVRRKRRVHFNAFMQEVHGILHGWRQDGRVLADPVPPLADALAADAALLCFDEFQINDIADALLLGRLFDALFARGVVVVATSNTAPDALFADRPGRDVFLPFIHSLNRHLDLLILDGGQDWRKLHDRTARSWLVPADRAARARLDAAFLRLSAGVAGAPARLLVQGRTLVLPCAAGGVVRVSFAELCARPLGSADYLAIATHYPAVMVEDVPRFDPDSADQTRRFISLIDALYEHRVKLHASAAAEPDALCVAGEAALAFQRTASRLCEMQTAEYMALPHLT